MATVIDALVITLGLDPKGVKKGSADAEGAMGKARAAAGRMGDGIDRGAQRGADAIRKLSREALAFFAVLTAGKTLKAFVADTTSSNVALGNMARNLGVSAQSLGAWQNVAAAFGGTASDVSGSMQSLVSQFQTIDGRQNLGRVFGQMGVGLAGANGQIRDMSELLPDLARAAQRLGPQQFAALGSQAGFSQGFINMLEQGPDKIAGLYRALRQYAPTEADVNASGQLMMDWTKLTSQSEAFGRTIMTSLTPEVHDLMQWVSKLIDKNQDWIRQDIDVYAKKIGDAIKNADWKAVGENLRAILDALRQIDWKAVSAGIISFASGANSAAKAVGGWGKALEYLFALWMGSKFLTVLGNARLLAAASGLSLGAPVIAAGATYALAKGGEPSLAKDDTIPRNIAFAPSTTKGSDFDVFAASVAQIEHANYGQMGGAGGKYAGKYQMGMDAISDASKRLGIATPTLPEFLANPELQEKIFQAHTKNNEAYLNAYSDQFRNATPERKLEILGYAHNQGASAAAKWLKTGVAGHDANNTYGTAYSDLIHRNLEASHAAIATAQAAPAQSISSTSTSTQTAHITINAPSGNARDIANEVGQQLQALNFRGRQTNLATQ